MLKQTSLRSAFFSVWFALIPAAMAVATVWLLMPSDADPAISGLRGLVKDQPVPALIVFFTVFEMLLYAIRDRLPLSTIAGYAGPPGLSKAERAEYEQARSLLEDARRILARRRRKIAREVPASARRELEQALADLNQSMQTQPLAVETFRAEYERASALVHRHLSRWQKSEIREYTESILVAVAVALLLRAFVVEAFKIPSGSMLPTLQLQDHIFVNKLIYGPTVPFTKARLWQSLPPSRGDVIVFEFPDPEPNPRPDYIKRVIALPGDTLEVVGGHPSINGWRVPSCSVGSYVFEEGAGVRRQGELFVEFLGENSYLTVYEDDHPEVEQGPYHVAPGEVWVLGDNRNNSSDSRAWNHNLGAGVPLENIKGRALFVWLSFGQDGWPTLDRWLSSVMGQPRLPKSAPARLVSGIASCLARRPANTNPPPPPHPLSNTP